MALGQIIYVFIFCFHDPLHKHNNTAQQLFGTQQTGWVDEWQLHFHFLPEDVEPWDFTLPSRKGNPVIRWRHSWEIFKQDYMSLIPTFYCPHLQTRMKAQTKFSSSLRMQRQNSHTGLGTGHSPFLPSALNCSVLRSVETPSSNPAAGSVILKVNSVYEKEKATS